MKISQKGYQSIPYIIIIITAIFSTGFLHPDEHFQILEFLNFKLNPNISVESLSWEYADKIRPFTQVFIYFVISKLSFITDPFYLSLLLRVFNGLIGIFAIKCISKYFIDNDGEYFKKISLFFLIWFVPLFLVRNSSESLSTSVFFIAAAYHLKSTNLRSLIISGLLYGISFSIRYQMGIVVFFVCLYLLIKNKNLKNFFIVSLGIFLGIILGLLTDYWGYGVLTFAPYNYFKVNILESRASTFGVSPFYYYLTAPVLKGLVLIPLFILFGIGKYIYKQKCDYWIVAFLSFFILHSMIPHKEIRFLMFNYILGALMFMKFSDSLFNRKSLFRILMILNILVLIRTSFFSLNSYMSLYKFVYRNEIAKLAMINITNGDFKFTMPFFQKNDVQTIRYTFEDAKKEKYILTKNLEEYLFVKSKDCEIKFSTYPSSLLSLKIASFLKRSSVFTIWTCQKIN